MGIRKSGGETIGILQLKGGMPADFANSLKADETDHRSDHSPLVSVTENEEVATLTATIETNLQQGDIATEAALRQQAIFLIS